MRSTSRIVVLAMALGLVGSAIAAPARAASITVNSLGDEPPADDGSCTLREAITAANTDMASGASVGECIAGSGADAITFSVSGTITVNVLPAIESDLSISGGGAVTFQGSCSALSIASGTVSLAGLTISGSMCFGPGPGGLGGDDGSGAGLFNAGTLTVTNSTFSGNFATASGGGIQNAGALFVENSTISGNGAAFGNGGGIDNGGVLTVTSSTISGNSAGFSIGRGGGIHNLGGTVTVTNSTVSGNSADGGGGGIYNVAGTVTLTNSTISGNPTGATGGGIVAAGSETLVNAIVAGNTAPLDPDVGLATLETVTTSLIGVPAGKSLADILDPAGLADNGGPTRTIALALVAGNPAIDTGTAATCATDPVNSVDQRGLPRPAACDIGAYEAQPPSLAAHADVFAVATTEAGALVSYIPPPGTDEQGGVATVACMPASGSTFAPGITTVTCTATDALGHTATGTFQVIVSAPGLRPTTAPSPTASASLLPNTAATGGIGGVLSLPSILGLLFLIGLVALAKPIIRSRSPSRRETVTGALDRRRG